MLPILHLGPLALQLPGLILLLGLWLGLALAERYSSRSGIQPDRLYNLVFLSLVMGLDVVTPTFAVLAMALGLAHLASGNAFGAPTRLPWGIELWEARRQPAQVYETLGAVAVLYAIWPGRRWVSRLLPESNFLIFLTMSSALRLSLEAFRGDSILLPGGLRAAQVAAFFVLAACLWITGRRLKWTL